MKWHVINLQLLDIYYLYTNTLGNRRLSCRVIGRNVDTVSFQLLLRCLGLDDEGVMYAWWMPFDKEVVYNCPYTHIYHMGYESYSVPSTSIFITTKSWSRVFIRSHFEKFMEVSSVPLLFDLTASRWVAYIDGPQESLPVFIDDLRKLKEVIFSRKVDISRSDI